MENLYGGPYSISGPESHTLYITVINEKYAAVETLTYPCIKAFKSGNFRGPYVCEVATAVAEHFYPEAPALIKRVNGINNTIRLLSGATVKEPFVVFDTIESVRKKLGKVTALTEDEKKAYTLYRTVKENLHAFSLAIEKMDPEVARRMGYPVKGEKK